MPKVTVLTSLNVRLEPTPRHSKSIEEWMHKERGSWDDSGQDPDHIYLVLDKLMRGQKVVVSAKQAARLMWTADYHSTSWYDEEISGGAVTKRTIRRWYDMFKEAGITPKY